LGDQGAGSSSHRRVVKRTIGQAEAKELEGEAKMKGSMVEKTRGEKLRGKRKAVGLCRTARNGALLKTGREKQKGTKRCG